MLTAVYFIVTATSMSNSAKTFTFILIHILRNLCLWCDFKLKHHKKNIKKEKLEKTRRYTISMTALPGLSIRKCFRLKQATNLAMTKLAFQPPKRFRSDSLMLIAHTQRIADKFIAQGIPRLSLRQLHYQLVSDMLTSTIYPNTDASYSKLGRLLKDARMTGALD
jgi:hypothetical protein